MEEPLTGDFKIDIKQDAIYQMGISDATNRILGVARGMEEKHRDGDNSSYGSPVEHGCIICARNYTLQALRDEVGKVVDN